MNISEDLHLWGCLLRLRQESALTDICLKSSDGDVLAHRVVLAAHSEYFRARCSAAWERPPGGTSRECVDLQHLSSEAIECVVDAVYSAHLNVDRASVYEAFACAHELAFPAVQKGCERVRMLAPSQRERFFLANHWNDASCCALLLSGWHNAASVVLNRQSAGM
jgi:BTB/POZ domain